MRIPRFKVRELMIGVLFSAIAMAAWVEVSKTQMNVIQEMLFQILLFGLVLVVVLIEGAAFLVYLAKWCRGPDETPAETYERSKHESHSR